MAHSSATSSATIARKSSKWVGHLSASIAQNDAHQFGQQATTSGAIVRNPAASHSATIAQGCAAMRRDHRAAERAIARGARELLLASLRIMLRFLAGFQPDFSGFLCGNCCALLRYGFELDVAWNWREI
ncbi:hypothetical protein F511_33550 [Dorcoceras hygrometricum]|uniref:Uncharacterized protein n=1 Tax=Dorcoceras hygrometricum TaxID=472368 RepID=A0A2Z7BFI2_9LAMI|nr:hypothetical protein F511_33550 [Dorcoceras hygrometricum]